MLKFMLMLPIRIICLPIIVALKLVFWLCSGILCMTEWIFGLAVGLLALMGIYSLVFDSTSYGIGLLVARLSGIPYIESICLQNSS